jgi:hypothetical protein
MFLRHQTTRRYSPEDRTVHSQRRENPCCLCILRIKFLMPEPIFMKLGMYIMANEHVSLLSLQANDSVKCIPSFGARQRLGKHFPVAKNTQATIEELLNE